MQGKKKSINSYNVSLGDNGAIFVVTLGTPEYILNVLLTGRILKYTRKKKREHKTHLNEVLVKISQPQLFQDERTAVSLFPTKSSLAYSHRF